MFNENKGQKKIDKVTGRFKDMITELDDGIQLLDDEYEKNAKEIQELRARNKEIRYETKAAERTRAGLQDIIGDSTEDGKKDR